MSDHLINGTQALSVKYEYEEDNLAIKEEAVKENIAILPKEKPQFTVIPGGLSEVKIESVKTSEQLKAFVSLPNELYKNDPMWPGQDEEEAVALLLPENNPLMRYVDYELFLAYKKDKVVGRIMAAVNETCNRHWNVNKGTFGYFECINDQEVANRLLAAAESWVKAKGKDSLIGPFSSSCYETVGVLVKGYNQRPTCGLSYNPPYYRNLIENYGMKKAKDVVELLATTKKIYDIAQIKQLSIQKLPYAEKISIRTVNYDNFEEEMKMVHDIFKKSFKEHWAYFDMEEDDFIELMESFIEIIPRDLFLVAEFDGKPVGFTLLNIDYNQKYFAERFKKECKIDRIKHYIMGILPEYQNMSIAKFFMKEIAFRLQKHDFYDVSFSWVLEDNYGSLGMVKWLGGELDKIYRVYRKRI